MKFGIYYAFWERQWGGNFLPYIEKVRRLGFDILEIATGDFASTTEKDLDELRKAAQDNGIILTGGYGPRFEHNVGTLDAKALDKAMDFYGMMFRKMDRADIRRLGGALYSYWPVDFSSAFDKEADRERSVIGMKRLASMAKDYGIELNMEALNRFEGYLINTADECISYVADVDCDNVKVMLDTFHMNIEEDCMQDAIVKTGSLLGHLHIGEQNRKLPGLGSIDWSKIAKALHKIGYDGYVVFEPFMLMGGQVGRDIKIWRDLIDGRTKQQIDQAVAGSLKFIRERFES